MHTVNSTNATVAHRHPVPPPAWNLRSPAEEMTALVLAARHGVPVHRVRLAIELSASPQRRS